jgi:lipoyl(octanoyl) transferase
MEMEMEGTRGPDAVLQPGGLVPPRLFVVELGVMEYDMAWQAQQRALGGVIRGEIPGDVLLLVEHPPVVTRGRSSKPGHLLASPAMLEARGVALREVERGGDVTIHEPGQLVAYPIVDLKRHRKDLHWYLRQVERGLIAALAAVGVPAERVAGLTGVWREGRKLASIGVHARDWVTWHGAALNVTNDLSTFGYVVPCGIDQVEMTSVARECARLGVAAPDMAAMRAAVVAGLGGVFGWEEVQTVSCSSMEQLFCGGPDAET